MTRRTAGSAFVLPLLGALALFSCQPSGPESIVIETFSPNGSFTADTYVDLFDAGGDPDADDPWSGDDRADAIAWDDNGSTDWANMSRIDLTGGLQPGTYYIRVRGSTAAVGIDDWYAVRVLWLQAGDPIPPYPDPLDPLTHLPLAAKPDAEEVDDDPSSGGVPTSPTPIQPGAANALSRSLYRDGTVTSDIDWFVLVIP